MSRIHEALKRAEQEKRALQQREQEAPARQQLKSEEEARPLPPPANGEGNLNSAGPQLREEKAPARQQLNSEEETRPLPPPNGDGNLNSAGLQLKKEKAPQAVPPAKEKQTPVMIVDPVVEQSARVTELHEETAGSIVRFEDLVRRCTRPEWKLSSVLEAFGNGDVGEMGAEGFRTLRSRLYQLAGTRKLRRLLITSSVPAEGKTFVAARLAESIVQQLDRRVLLIDADLRAPRLHVALGTGSTPGLTDYLRGEADEYTVIQKSPECNLCFIPCGSNVSNPAELLLGSRLKELLDRVTDVFDWVILDSPPSLPVHDASNLAGLCEGVLLIVRAGKTDYESAKKASLEFQHKNLIGVVLNQVEEAELQGHYYYSYNDGK
jgi:protein-tyrosine kinase